MEDLFPRTSKYDREWINSNLMGPDTLWLTESLCSRTPLSPGMRVMDLGCGRAISSVFLAREFDIEVWAVDLWIEPTDNWKRVREAGLSGQVYPIYADARSLPFPHDFFDAIISVDAYHYFGTDDFYLDYLAQFLKPEGSIAIACPAFKKELAGDIPEYLGSYYSRGQWHSFHSPQWWQYHWEKTGVVKVTCAEEMPEAWEIWKANAETPENPDAAVILTDQGRLLTFSRVVANKLPLEPTERIIG